MANSFTGLINTNGEFVTVESVTVGVEGSNFTGFTSGSSYTIQIKDFCTLKVSDAEFDLNKRELQYKAGSDDLYIKTNSMGCGLAILEEEQS